MVFWDQQILLSGIIQNTGHPNFCTILWLAVSTRYGHPNSQAFFRSRSLKSSFSMMFSCMSPLPVLYIQEFSLTVVAVLSLQVLDLYPRSTIMQIPSKPFSFNSFRISFQLDTCNLAEGFYSITKLDWVVEISNEAFAKSNEARHALCANCLSICLRGDAPKHVPEPISRAHGHSAHASPHHRNHDACFSLLPWTRCPVAFH
jgi:hypothetical protein